MFPPLGPRDASKGVQPLDADGSQLPTVEEAPAEEVEHFHDTPPMSETRTSADAPVPEDVDLDDMIERLPDELFKRPLEEVSGASGASSSTSRPRLEPPLTFERKRETSEVSEAASKLQRISSWFRTSDHPTRLLDLRVSAVTTKQALEVPVAVNQDEDELTLEEHFKTPLFWQSVDFTYEEEKAGMNKEMQSMLNFTPAQLQTVISTRWVKTRKFDGTCRCRIVVRGYDQVVEDPDETYASTPSLLTLKTFLTLAVARGWHVTLADVSTAFLHAPMDGEVLVLPPVEYYPSGDVVWKLKRALYGLKNAPKLWQQHFASTLESKGFQRMKSDPNLYFHAKRKIYLLCYVDDLMLFGERKAVADLVADLQKELLLRVTGELSEGQEATFLGRHMRRTSTSTQMFMETSYVDRICGGRQLPCRCSWKLRMLTAYLSWLAWRLAKLLRLPALTHLSVARRNLQNRCRRRSISSTANLSVSCCG